MVDGGRERAREKGVGVWESAPLARPWDRSYASQVWSRSSSGNRLRLGGIEFGGLIEVVWGWALGELFRIRPHEDQAEFRLGRSSGRMERGRRGGLADVSKDLGDGPRVDEEGDEGEGEVAGGANQREDLIDPGEEGGLPGGARGGDPEPSGPGGSGLAGGSGWGWRVRSGTRVWTAAALSSRARAVTRGFRGALGAKTPW